ncbi:hypothetical protein BDW68DRAFT_153358 [Aspergillus falconensis]
MAEQEYTFVLEIMTLKLVFAGLLIVSTPARLRSKNCESRVQLPGAALRRAAVKKISKMTYWANSLAGT